MSWAPDIIYVECDELVIKDQLKNELLSPRPDIDQIWYGSIDNQSRSSWAPDEIYIKDQEPKVQ